MELLFKRLEIVGHGLEINGKDLASVRSCPKHIKSGAENKYYIFMANRKWLSERDFEAPPSEVCEELP